eukprot:m.155643 g.155643  ORF g.155643 m.155643 type:complete len:340 (-) comp16422_c0_seq5:4203-5222(-)
MFGFPRARHHGPVYSDPYGYNRARSSGYDDYDMYDPWQSQARQQQAQRRAQQQQQQRQRKQQEQQRQLALKQARLAKLKEYTNACIVIQRAWRRYQARVQFEEQDDAAYVITDFVRRYIAVRKAKNIINSLRRLKQLHRQLDELVENFQTNMRGYRNMLLFNDQVEKLIFKLDEVQHYRNNFVRAKRKSIVNDAQDALKISDQLLKTMRRKLAVIVKMLRAHVSTKHTHTRDAAARVIQRFLRALPGVRTAKRDLNSLRLLRAAEQEVASLHAELATKLLRLQAQAYATMDTTEDSMVRTRAKTLLEKTTTEYDGLLQVDWPQSTLEPESKRSKSQPDQ